MRSSLQYQIFGPDHANWFHLQVYPVQYKNEPPNEPHYGEEWGWGFYIFSSTYIINTLYTRSFPYQNIKQIVY